MKTSLCFLFCSFCLLGSIAFAGRPADDPTVAQIQESFRLGTPATAADIIVGKKYSCYIFQAWKSAYEIIPIEVSFEQIAGGLFLNQSAGISRRQVYRLTATGMGLEAKLRDLNESQIVLKISADKSLVSEQSMAQKIDGTVKAVAYPKNYLANYTACAP